MTAKSNDERVVSQTKDVGFQIGGRKTFAIAPTENKWTFCLSSTSLSFETRPPARELALQVGVATLGRFVFNTSRRFVYPFAPALSRGLGVPLTAITSLIAINQATGLLSPFFGPVSDRWGYRVMMLAGLGMLAVGMFASGVLPLYGIIMIALFLAGLGKSIFDPALLAYLGERVPFHRRGLVIGITEFAWAAGSLVGITLAGLLIDRLGWQAPFLTLGGLSLLCLAGLAFLLPPTSGRRDQATEKTNFKKTWQQLRQSPMALAALGFGFLISIANDNLFVVLGLWLESFGLSLAAVGLAASVIGVAELVGETGTAIVADRIGLPRAVLVGMSLATVGYLLLPLVGVTLPLALASLFILFLFFEFSVVTSLSLFTEVLPEARATMMSALFAALSLGRMVGAFSGGLVWAMGGLLGVGIVSAVASALALACLGIGLRAWRRGRTGV